MNVVIRIKRLIFYSSSRPREAPISEPLPCAECGKMEMVSVVETCRLADGLTVKRLRHCRCRSCGARFFDDAAMHRIQEQRAAARLAARQIPGSKGTRAMSTTRQDPRESQPPVSRWYRGAKVPMTVIRRFARQVAERFSPDKILLFGSHAYGAPHAHSDVDVLVIMPARNQLDQAVRISLAIDPPFPLDIIVRTPHAMSWRLAEGDSFLREITSKGKVLYEATDGGKRPKPR